MTTDTVTLTITPKFAGFVLTMMETARASILLNNRRVRLTYTLLGRSVPNHVCREQGRAKARADARVRRARRLVAENATRPVITKGARR